MQKTQTELQRQGLTLVELMFVIAIIGILTAVAVPSVLTWMPNARMNGAARDLYGTFVKAKGEAAKRNRNCTVIFNQPIPQPPPAVPITYAYVLFEDSITVNSAYDAGEPIIFQMQRWPQGVFLDPTQDGGDGLSFVNRGPGCAGNPAITFRPTTIPISDVCGLANGRASLTNTNGRLRRVVVNNTGNVRIVDN